MTRSMLRTAFAACLLCLIMAWTAEGGAFTSPTNDTNVGAGTLINLSAWGEASFTFGGNIYTVDPGLTFAALKDATSGMRVESINLVYVFDPIAETYTYTPDPEDEDLYPTTLGSYNLLLDYEGTDGNMDIEDIVFSVTVNVVPS